MAVRFKIATTALAILLLFLVIFAVEVVSAQESIGDNQPSSKTSDWAENMMAKNMVAQNQHQNALAQYENMETGDYVRGFKSWVPFYSWYNLNQALPEAQSSQEGIGMGSEIAAIVAQIWSIPDPREMAQTYHDTFQRLWNGSPDDAMRFAEAMNSYSGNSKNLDNLRSAIDIGLFVLYVAVCWKLFKPQTLNIIWWPIFRSVFKINRGRSILVGIGLLWLILFLI